MNKTIIIITGPTASGKTSMALQLARKYNTEIISADSRQCFREMNIGVAKPSSVELASVKHYFINSHSIHEDVNAATFEQYALNAASEIFKHNDVGIMAGGTGLYIKAFCEGLDDIPAVPADLRAEIIHQYEQKGLQWLQEELKVRDPLYYSDGEIQNPQRIMRALEVKLATGKSIKEFQKKGKVRRDFNIVKYGIEISKEQLHSNINLRVDKMMEDGLLEEVRSLLPYRHLNALQTVGYAEIFDYLDGKITLEEAVERIKINTRQYAKRQMTWFRKDKEIQWFSGPPPGAPRLPPPAGDGANL
jgi:tRNA dimethylallyltransferase